MAGITLAQAEAQLALYLDAEAKVLLSQKVTLAGKDLTRADLEAVQKGVKIWSTRVSQLSRTGGARIRQVIPI